MSDAQLSMFQQADASPFIFDPLERGAYGLIAIDPPWRMKMRSAKGITQKSAQSKYRTMTDAEILALPVQDLAARDCVMLLWAISAMVPLSLACIERWGFEYKSFMLWRKLTKNKKLRWGPGYRVRSTGELILIATRGKPVQAWKPPTELDGLARENSRKPEEFYQRAERMMPSARRADVFSREDRPGWEAFGDEAGMFNAT